MNPARFAAAAAFLTALPLTAATYTAVATDGAIATATVLEGRYIVELDAMPRAFGGDARSAASTSMVLERFRRDFEALGTEVRAASGTNAPAGPPPAIRREYANVLVGAAVTASAETARAIERLPYVRRVTPDVLMNARAGSVASGIRADMVHAQFSARGEGIVVAVIDSGIDYNHPALGGGFGPGRKVAGGWDFINDDGDPMDDAGHGTHVAGILAGSGDRIAGVAPAATLLAYKVLDAFGSGPMTEVIAAIERATDPNGDGDLADRVHVMNISLGGPGDGTDPASLAVNNAVAAGIVVCIASGNSGRYHAIGSPGAAAGAITVGASDGVAIARFSSKGPAPGAYSVKPEVVAPGVDIESTLPHGEYGPNSGTSMATPHVAGLAALLRQIHPAWTPAEVKSAIVGTTVDLHDEIMAQGSGQVDALAAATTQLLANPPLLSFGIDDVAQPVWEKTERVEVRNYGGSARTVSFTQPPVYPFGLSISVIPASASIPAGGTAAFDVTIRADNQNATFPDSLSMSVGGTAGGASSTVRVAWGVVKAARVRMARTTEPGYVLAASGLFYTSAVTKAGDGIWDLIMPSGTYDVLVVSGSGGGSDGAPPHVIVRENLDVRGFVEIDADDEEAIHEIALDAVDVEGKRLRELPRSTGSGRGRGTQVYRSRLLLGFPSGSSIRLVDLGGLPSSTFRVSTFSDRFRLLPSEFYVDLDQTRRAYSVEYPALHGITAPAALPPPMLLRQPLRALFPRASEGRRITFGHAVHIRHDGGAIVDTISGWLKPVEGEEWNGELFMTADADPELGSTTQISGFIGWTDRPAVGSGIPLFESQPFRSDGERVSSFGYRDPGPAAVAVRGESLTFGDGPAHPQGPLSVIPGQSVFTGHLLWTGPNNESRRHDSQNAFWTLRKDGRTVSSGRQGFSPILVMPSDGDGNYELTLTSRGAEVAGRPAIARMTSTFTAGLDDGEPPTVTSFRIATATGIPSSRFASGEPATLRFSAADLHFEDRAFSEPLAAGATKAWARRAGGEWMPLTLALVATDLDPTASGQSHFPEGEVYEANLGAWTSSDGLVAIRVEFEDLSGNRTEYIADPAFVVGDPPPATRRRLISP